jgi:CubicO group peptidase (beta-lactamase class C family)
MQRFFFPLFFAALWQGGHPANSEPLMRFATPARAGLPATLTAQLDRDLESAVERGATAGVEALFLIEDRAIYRRAFGWLQKEPEKIPLRQGSVFDLASLTKVVVTTTAVMILVDRGLVRLEDPVGRYLPEFGSKGKESITIRDLLRHSSGLPAFAPLFRDHQGKDAFYRAVCDMEVRPATERQRLYSDLGFMTLGWMVEKVAARGLDRFAQEEIFRPLGMNRTRYNPPPSWRSRCVPTEQCPIRHRLLRGEVHDENAWALGGVSGHAGLFSTVEDLSIFARMLLGDGEFRGRRILSVEAVHEMLRAQGIKGEIPQLLGWWQRNPSPEASVFLLSESAFGHTGFTGTSLWIDPGSRAVAIVLANAIHPSRQQADPASFRREFHTHLVAALAQRKRGTP